MIREELKKLLEALTLEEKIGQLTQVTPDFFALDGEITGPAKDWSVTKKKLFSVGSVLGTHTKEQVMTIQTDYMKHHRLHIPLVFMADVIHGYETIFPIPLALASSFDEKLIESVAQASAKEASAAGIQVTFSPMADYVKDARWGRVMEANGEDATLSARLTAAYVRGYQGQDLTQPENIAACVKHFVGYGAAEGGRDYNAVDMSQRELYQNYLPSFQAAVDENVALVMTSFNTFNGVPVTCNSPLIQTVLRQKLGFKGVVISDWGAVGELISHGVAADSAAAADLAFQAGIDMEMMSPHYQLHLEDLMTTPAMLKKLDEEVWRILTLKNELGLFEDPYRGLRAANVLALNKGELLKATEDAAVKSCVLLKNENILPLKAGEKIILAGPLATTHDSLGAWSWVGQKEEAQSLAEVLGENGDVTVMPEINFAKASVREKLATADKIILALGESSAETGEAASKAHLTLPEDQLALVQQLAAINSQIIVVLYTGRPLDLSALTPQIKGLLVAWFPGSRGSEALVRLLFGADTPSGVLPMSFPRSVGQLPLSYQQVKTGRPQTAENHAEKYTSRYLDEENSPLFPFGFGLSYGNTEISHVTVSPHHLLPASHIVVTAYLENLSERADARTLQLYIRQKVAEVAPVLRLVKWQKVTLAPHATATISLTLTQADLAYVHQDLTTRTDKAQVELFLGFSSEAPLVGELTV